MIGKELAVERLLDIGLSNALIALGLAAAVALTGRLSRRPALVHSLWLLVLLKLVTPPLWTVRLNWPSAATPVARTQPPTPLAVVLPIEPARPEFGERTARIISHSAAVQPEPIGIQPGNEPVLGSPSPIESPLTTTEPAIAPPVRATASSTEGVLVWRFSWRGTLLTAWLGGSTIWLGLACSRIVRFARLLRHASPAPRELQDHAHELACRIGLRRAPGVWLVPGSVSPLVWALGCRPKLLLPLRLWKELDDRQRDTLLLHELAHLRRRDHWVRIFELLVTALYWWHPVVWWARHAIREAEELCCDAWVVWALPASAKAYATALLQTMHFLSDTRSHIPVAASGVGHFSGLKRRLTMIMQETRPRALSWAGRLAVLGLAALLLPIAPSLAQRSDRDQDQPRREADRDDEDAPKDVPKRPDEAKRQRDRARVESDDAQADREARVAKAREDVERLARELNEQRRRIDGELREVRAKFEEQMREAQRPLRELQEQMAMAQRRLAELQGRSQFGGSGRGAGFEGGYGAGHHPGGLPGGPGYGGGFAPHPGAPGTPFMPPVPPVPPVPPIPGSSPHAGAIVGPHGGVMAGPHDGGNPDLERRLSDLERKLDRVLDEVSRLKEDRRSDRPRDRESRP